jgi:hypothetical protein
VQGRNDMPGRIPGERENCQLHVSCPS